jgi:hypothetical protein
MLKHPGLSDGGCRVGGFVQRRKLVVAKALRAATEGAAVLCGQFGLAHRAHCGRPRAPQNNPTNKSDHLERVSPHRSENRGAFTWTGSQAAPELSLEAATL